MTEYAPDTTAQDAASQEAAAHPYPAMAGRELTPEDEDLLGDAIAFEGVSKYPARIKCALLGWMAWKDATAQALAAADADRQEQA